MKKNGGGGGGGSSDCGTMVPWWYLKKWDISWRDGPATPKKKEYE